MTGIAVGLVDIANISVGNTPIVKVSVGDVQVWPSAAPPAAPIAFFTNVTAQDPGGQIVVPIDVLPGDLIIMCDRANGTGATNVVPSGFTQVGTSSPGVGRITVSFKIADGSEAGTVLTGMTGSGGDSKSLTVFRGVSPITSVIRAGGAINMVSSGAVPGQTMDTADVIGAGDRNVVMFSWASAGNPTVVNWSGGVSRAGGYSFANNAVAYGFGSQFDAAVLTSESSIGSIRALFSWMFSCQF